MTGAYDILKEISDFRLEQIRIAMDLFKAAQEKYIDNPSDFNAWHAERHRLHLVELLTMHLN